MTFILLLYSCLIKIDLTSTLISKCCKIVNSTTNSIKKHFRLQQVFINNKMFINSCFIKEDLTLINPKTNLNLTKTTTKKYIKL